MVVGVLKLNLVIPENHSLKGKRGVMKTHPGARRAIDSIFPLPSAAIRTCGRAPCWALRSPAPASRDRSDTDQVVDFVDELGLAEVGAAGIEFFYC